MMMEWKIELNHTTVYARLDKTDVYQVKNREWNVFLYEARE